MAASLMRFVRGGLGRSINGIMSTFCYENVHITCCLYVLRCRCLCLPINSIICFIQQSNVSRLTFELANANRPQWLRIVYILAVISWKFIGKTVFFFKHGVFVGNMSGLILLDITCVDSVSEENTFRESFLKKYFWCFRSCKVFVSPSAAEETAGLCSW